MLAATVGPRRFRSSLPPWRRVAGCQRRVHDGSNGNSLRRARFQFTARHAGFLMRRRLRQRRLPPGPAETSYDPRGHQVAVNDFTGQRTHVFVTWDEWKAAAQVRMGMMSKERALRLGRPLRDDEIEPAPKSVSEWFSV
jgi:hypothetical protein